MTIFPYIKAIRKGILYPQGINKRSLFTDFHVPTNRVPPTIENAIKTIEILEYKRNKKKK